MTTEPKPDTSPTEEDALTTFVQAYPCPTPEDTRSWQFLFPEHAAALAACARILGMLAAAHPGIRDVARLVPGDWYEPRDEGRTLH